jgi:hypothetical protein
MKFKKGRDLSGFSKVEDDMTVRETRGFLKAFSCCREMRCNAARTGCFSRAGLLITTSICICVINQVINHTSIASAAHSRFKIPIDLHDESTCNITQQMKVAKLVRKADLIIWDEAPMMHRRAFETVDQTVRDLMQLDDAQATEKIFGGKTVVLGGDF